MNWKKISIDVSLIVQVCHTASHLDNDNITCIFKVNLSFLRDVQSKCCFNFFKFFLEISIYLMTNFF